ncbi:methyl-accepting chemotaxis sensory transducer [Hydrogenispora ethanolica]|uniref:Methyl-accepting chemotaxis sensory transducer n=1 Tax=Hydrogenispora ethanolica TaxID=1082276 RepID=A0A4R1RH07_HYDET|nr:methyl-accepting chemotaxis protein [Hydrogenispora ethanolica]TCL65314.1 methyl-accepting chemotaxis sensory transducer [Hydrogenispora ethanolica]
MKWFHNLKIGTKLLSAFVLVALIAGVVGVTGILNMNAIRDAGTEMYQLNTLPLEQIGNARVAYQRIRVNLRDLLVERGRKDRTAYVDSIKEADQQLTAALSDFEKTLRTEKGSREIARFREAHAKFAPIQEKIIELAVSNREDEALATLRDATPLAVAIDQSLEKLGEMKVALAVAKSRQNEVVASRAQWTMILFIALGIILAIGLGLWIARIISKPVSGLMEGAQQIARGDLNVRVAVSSRDEIGVLAEAFRTMAGNINEVMTNINAAAEQVAAGAKQVSDSSMALSQGATEQASTIEELSAVIEEISSQTRQNAENAGQANELAETAQVNASQGNEQMNGMLRAMEEINEASGNISKIIKVIDEIAFQTNILALNAAVEAARAGQQGKGFAVVAEEVRNLAARSADAAKETTALIEGTIKKVEGGTKIANNTAEALDRIVADVGKVTRLVGEIAIACREQATGIAQVNQGVMQVSQVVQTNSATSEETAASSEELSGQANLLREQVGKFTLQRNRRSGLEEIRPELLEMLEKMHQQQNAAERPAAPAGNGKAAPENLPAAAPAGFGKYGVAAAASKNIDNGEIPF